MRYLKSFKLTHCIDISQQPKRLNSFLNPQKDLEENSIIDSKVYKDSIFHPDYLYFPFHKLSKIG